MKPVKVMFDSMKDCEKYVMAVESYPYNIDLQCGRQIIDGKSILGILGFGCHKVLELRAHTDDEEEIDELLGKIGFCLCGEEMKLAI